MFLFPNDPNYRIDKDPSNFILQELRQINVMKDNKKTGKTKEKWVVIGYYSSMKGAQRGYYSRGFDNCENIQDCVDRLELLEGGV